MKNNSKKIIISLLALVLFLILTPIARAESVEPYDNDDFDQMLDDLRETFFDQPEVENLHQVHVDDEHIIHQPPEHITLEVEDAPSIMAINTQVYVEGSQRDFQIRNEAGSIRSAAPGTLIRQGQHVNIWVIDQGFQTNPAPDISGDLNLLDDMINNFDSIFVHMTHDFAPFTGVRVATPFGAQMPFVGDVNEDGRINVLLYNISNKPPGGGGSFVSGFFGSGDFMTTNGNIPIAMFHMDIASGFGYDLLQNNPLSFYDTFAHEFQHLLFYMYLGVYTARVGGPFHASEISWFNEALSELAGKFYAEYGTEVVSVGRTISASENAYIGSGYGDFLSFNNSLKNYGMSRFHSLLMHRNTGGNYMRDVYDFLINFLPPAQTVGEWWDNEANLGNAGMVETVGNAFAHAGLTDAIGETAFNLLYFLFMENFASDGGNVIVGQDSFATTQFHTSYYSAHNLWGIRPNLGLATGPNGQNAVFVSSGSISLSGRTAFPVLQTGGDISLTGYGGATPRGASHEMFYRLIGETPTNPVLTISINDNNPFTQYYVVVPNDPVGSFSSWDNVQLGNQGADVFLLERNGVENFIDTGGQVAYLFISTLYQDVSTTVAYSWGDTIPTTLSLTPDEVTIDNDNLTATATIGGTASGSISLDTSDLPAGVTAHVVDDVITVTGQIPGVGGFEIVGIFDIKVIRQGISETLLVNVNLIREDDICNIIAQGQFADQAGADGVAGAPWILCDDGVLIVDEGFISWFNVATSPWQVHNANIERIVFTGAITAGSSLSGLFTNLTNVMEIEGLTYFDTSDVTNMSWMFGWTGGLSSLDLSSFDTSSVTNMSGMFRGASGLTNLDLSNFDTSSVTDMSIMFSAANSLMSLDLSNFNTNSVINMSGMFTEVWGLTTLDLSNFNTSQVTDMSRMFSDANSLITLDISSFDTSSVTNMSGMFGWTNELINLDFPLTFDTSSVTDMSFMFSNTSSLTSLDLLDFDTSQVINMDSMFSGASGLTSLDLSSFDTSSVIYINSMFNGASGLTNLDLSNFDTSNVRYMGWMFFRASNLTELDLSGWDTSQVTEMIRVFYEASSLSELDISDWDTSSVTHMNDMFTSTSSLRALTLGEYFAFVVNDELWWMSDDANLPTINPTDEFTGYWRNVGSGSIANPTGQLVFTSAQLMEQFDGSSMADTFVWQPTNQSTNPIETLGQLIAEAEARIQGNYTPRSWANMMSMLTFARSVYNNPTATDAQYNDAINLLSARLNELIEL